MKRCVQCGAERPDGDKICTFCGTPLPVVEEGVTPPVEAETPSEVSADPKPKKKKKKKGLLIGLLVLLVLLIGTAVAGWLTNWFGLVTPLSGLLKAAKKTAEAGSFTVEISLKEKGDWGSSKHSAEGRAIVDWEKKELTAFGEVNGDEYLLVDDDFYSLDGAYSYKSTMPVNEAGKESEELVDIQKGEIDWEGIFDRLGLDEQLNAKNMNAFIKKTYTDYLCDDEWLEENLGFEKDGGVYTFRPDVERVAESIVDMASETDVFKKDAQNQVEDFLDDVNFNVIQDFEVSFTVEGGYITNVKVVLEIDDELLTAEITLTEIGKTTISQEEIDDFIDEVEDFIEDDTCSECGYRMWGRDECYRCNYETCEYCYKDIHTGGGESTYGYEHYDPLCYDCYTNFIFETCEYCHDDIDTRYERIYLGGSYSMLCYDCYDGHVCDRCNRWTDKRYSWAGYSTLCYSCYWAV